MTTPSTLRLNRPILRAAMAVAVLLSVGLVLGLMSPADAGRVTRVRDVETVVPTAVEPLEQFFADCRYVHRAERRDGRAVEWQNCRLTETDPAYPGEPPDERFVFRGGPCLWTSDYFRATDGSVVVADSLRVVVRPSGRVTVRSTYPAEAIDPVDGCRREPQFEPAECWFPIPDGRSAECGHLVVPEDRATPFSPDIRIGVARFHHPSGDPEPDPIVYLAGGPGERIVDVFSFPGAIEGIVAPLFPANRDVIFFDQRGVGVSQPNLACAIGDSYRELLDYEADGETLTSRAVGERLAADSVECGRRLGRSVDLSAYNSVASVADIGDLRTVLGYDQLNLWGVSYGSRLAQVAMQHDPDGIRSVTIDAIMAQDLELTEFVAAADRAFRELFDSCAAEPACSQAFPDLDQTFGATITSLNDDPPVLDLVDPQTGQPFTARLTGDLFAVLLYQSLYDTEIVPFLPAVIHATSQGDYSAVADGIVGLVGVDATQDFGMFFSVRCNRDAVELPTLQEYDAVVAGFPTLRGFTDIHLPFRPLAAICQDWDAGTADPSAWEPVTGDIPTLAMTGQFDPNLAPAAGKSVADALGNAHYFEYPGIGHGSVGSHPCPTAMFIEFVIEPDRAPDAGCMAGMGVQFFTPGQ